MNPFTLPHSDLISFLEVVVVAAAGPTPSPALVSGTCRGRKSGRLSFAFLSSSSMVFLAWSGPMRLFGRAVRAYLWPAKILAFGLVVGCRALEGTVESGLGDCGLVVAGSHTCPWRLQVRDLDGWDRVEGPFARVDLAWADLCQADRVSAVVGSSRPGDREWKMTLG